MILSDFIQEYEIAAKELNFLNSFLNSADEIQKNYLNDISDAIKWLQSQKSIDHFERAISIASRKLRELISKDLYLLIINFGKIEDLTFKNRYLNSTIADFRKSVDSLFQFSINFLSNNDSTFQKSSLLTDFFMRIDSLKESYNLFKASIRSLTTIEQSLLEPVPIPDGKELTTLDIRSGKSHSDLKMYVSDLQNLSAFCERVEQILSTENHQTIFVQKIESGTLNVKWGSGEIDLKILGNIIQSLINAYRSLRMLGPEISKAKAEASLKAEEARALRIENDKKELLLINSVRKELADSLHLDPDNAADIETIQQATIPMVRYLYNNPVGTINGEPYDISHDQYLLQNFYGNGDEA